jgi:glycosyltransferase involved in cell wall biosynthesis
MRFFFLSYAYERGLRADAGGFRKVWELAWALERLGHEVLVLYPRLPGHVPLRPVPCRAYPVLDLPVLRPATAYLSMVGQAVAIGLRKRPDIVYFRSCLSVLPLLLRGALSAKVALEVNADTVEFLHGEGAGPFRRWLFRLVEAVNARGSNVIVTLTPGLKRTLAERYGIPEGKIRVIPSGTDPDHFVPADSRETKARLGFELDQPVVGFVGIFYRHQGVHTLLHAVPRILRDLPTTRFLLVGDGVMRPTWETLARRLALPRAVHFTGQIPYRDLPGYLQAMDLLVAPRGEASPFKILDALSAGRPVIASDLPSIRHLAQECQGAVTLVPPDDPAALADAVGDLLGNRERLASLGEVGRVVVERHFSWSVIAAGVAEAAAQVAREHP